MSSKKLAQVVLADDLFSGHYDESNALMLPSSRVKTAQKQKRIAKPKRCLTKKQRKALEKIVKRRSDKKNRVDLLKELQEHALPESIYKSLTPLVHVQQFKKHGRKSKEKLNFMSSNVGITKAATTPIPKNAKKSTHNVLDFEVPDESDSDSSVLSMEMVEPARSHTKNEPIPVMVCEAEEKSELVSQSVPEKREVQEFLAVSASTLAKPEKETRKGPEAIKRLQISTAKPNEINVQRQCVIPTRTKEIEAIRSKLPIIGEEQVIMEAVNENLVVVLAGETGSGKTTQVPQFLYEAGYADNGKIIGVTEPRRIAAIAMSQRVANELNVTKNVVSYQIRFEGNTSKKTKIKFMTDGVLLKEMEKDFLLNNYSVICIDEAHERSLYTDILIGLLSRAVLIRQKRQDPLRVVVMSATMRVEDFTKNSLLFKKTPAFINIPVRQFHVDIHYNRITPENYLDAARKKVSKIHSTLPEGGILVFVTGQEEVRRLVKLLRRKFSSSEDKKHANIKDHITDKNLVGQEFDLSKVKAFPSQTDQNQQESDSDEIDDEDMEEPTDGAEPLNVIPLYSMLSMKEQERVFAPSPGVRVCVVATNVAETSLTIPGMRYVVDCGKVKLKQWDKLTGVQKYEVTWCSKASAEQRAGRAGRTGPGHCYRLFSSAVYDSEFIEYSVPEIKIRPVDDMFLLMKSMSINQVRSFPYPTHPGDTQLVAAERLLILLGALELPEDLSKSKGKEDRSRITTLGKTMAYLPVSPRFSKMIAVSFPHSIVEYVIVLVAALSVKEVLLDVSAHTEDNKTRFEWQQIRRKWGGKGSSLLLGDCMVLLRAVGAFEFEGGTNECALRLGLYYKSMMEIRKLRKKLTADINLVVSSQETLLNPHMKPPTPEQSDLLRQVILSGCPDKIAKALSPEELTGDMKKLKHAYRCGELEEPVFIHDSSVLRGSDPEWIVYQESFEFNGRIYLKGVTAIDPEWIPIVCPNYSRKVPLL